MDNPANVLAGLLYIFVLLLNLKYYQRIFAALTFTKRAAEELKSRIYHYGKAVLGHNMGFAHMYVETIHGAGFGYAEIY